jgi:tetratricopeptide (TPR) repeat protein
MGPRPLALFALVLLAVAPSSARAGYTHYWTWQADPNAGELGRCIAEMQQIAAARGDRITVRSDGTSITINGLGADAHEDFRFPRASAEDEGDRFQFCKTAGKPYDEVVTACLIVARDHFPPQVLDIASDGEWADWAAGRALYETVLGRPARSPFASPPEGFAWATPAGPPLFRSGLLTLLAVGVLLYFLFLRGRGGGGWGSYYLFWLVGPALIAAVTTHPEVLLVVVVGLIARRWLPDPYLVIRHAGRIRALQADVRANPHNAIARRDLAVIWLAKHRPRRALPLAEEALTRDPESIELSYLLGLCRLGLGQNEAALDALLTVVHREPRFRYGDASLRAADALLALGRWQDAEDGLQHFLSINGSSLEGLCKLARARREGGDRDGARKALAEARQVYRQLPGFQRRRQVGWYLQARLAAAIL